MRRLRGSRTADGDPLAPAEPRRPQTDAQRRIADLETQVVSLLVAADRAAAIHDLTCQYAQTLIQTQGLLAEARRENAEMYARLRGLLKQIRALNPRRAIESPARMDHRHRTPQ